MEKLSLEVVKWVVQVILLKSENGVYTDLTPKHLTTQTPKKALERSNHTCRIDFFEANDSISSTKWESWSYQQKINFHYPRIWGPRLQVTRLSTSLLPAPPSTLGYLLCSILVSPECKGRGKRRNFHWASPSSHYHPWYEDDVETDVKFSARQGKVQLLYNPRKVGPHKQCWIFFTEAIIHSVLSPSSANNYESNCCEKLNRAIHWKSKNWISVPASLCFIAQPVASHFTPQFLNCKNERAGPDSLSALTFYTPAIAPGVRQLPTYPALNS